MGKRRRGLRAALPALPALLAITVTLLPAHALGAAGEPDPSFGGGDGFTVLDDAGGVNEFLNDVVVLPDGKIVGAGARGSAGGFLLARFNADGTPDTSFGGTGIRVEPDLEVEPGLGTPGSPRGIASIVLRSDGKLAVAGLGRGPGKVNAFEFARYLPNGELDPTFGSGGLTTVWFNPSGDAFDLAQAPDGKLVATGSNGTGNVAVVARVTEGGLPDTTFHAVTPAGVRFVDVPGSPNEEGEAVSVLADGAVLIGGIASNGAFLAELNASGNPVMGFGTEGIAVFNLGTEAQPSGEFFDLAVLPDGRIIAAGDGFPGSNDEEAVIARFTPSGQLDTSFGNGGLFRSNPTPGEDEIESMEVLPDGRILAAGLRGETGVETEDADTWLFRLTPNGQLDPSFGSGGEVFASASPETDAAYGLAVQPDGKAVVAGEANSTGASQLMVGRFTGDAPPEPAGVTAKCAGRPATIVGTGGAEKIIGTKRRDVIVARGGKDRIRSSGGNDLICAGAGKDGVRGGAGNDTIRGEAGADSLFGQAGKDLLLGGAANDRLFGGGGRKDGCVGGPGRRDRGSRSCERLKRIP